VIVATSAIEEARNRLADAVLGAVALLPAWRVHRYPPSSVVSPCVWVDMPSLQTIPDAVIAEFSVVLVIDGQEPAQVRAFDLALAALYDALNRLDAVAVMNAYPGAKDIGGPTQRTYALTVTAYLRHDPLCFLPLSDAVADEPTEARR
jgi:hypothetical protein